MNSTVFPTHNSIPAQANAARTTGSRSLFMTKLMKRLIRPALLAFGAAALLPGCDDRDTSAKDPAAKRFHLAFVANSPGEYWAVVNLGCDIAAQQLGDVDLDFRYPTEATVEAQQQIVSNLLAAGIDGIAISPIDAEKQTAFLNTVAAKTLLVCADSDAPQSKRATYIGTDNVAAGAEAAVLIKEALPAGGKIALFSGYAKAQNTKDRIQGIRDALKGSNIEIIEVLEDSQQAAVTRTNLTRVLAKHGDVAGVIGLAGCHGPALLTALRDAGKVGQIKIVCFDDNTETLAGIVAGEIHGTIAQKPFQIGKQTIVQMDKYLRGDKTQLAQPRTFIASRMLTKQNVDHYIAEQRNISYFLKDKAP